MKIVRYNNWTYNVQKKKKKNLGIVLGTTDQDHFQKFKRNLAPRKQKIKK